MVWNFSHYSKHSFWHFPTTKVCNQVKRGSRTMHSLLQGVINFTPFASYMNPYNFRSPWEVFTVHKTMKMQVQIITAHSWDTKLQYTRRKKKNPWFIAGRKQQLCRSQPPPALKTGIHLALSTFAHLLFYTLSNFYLAPIWLPLQLRRGGVPRGFSSLQKNKVVRQPLSCKIKKLLKSKKKRLKDS